jgi:hypothetical protein
MTALRTLLAGLLYGIIGTIVTIAGYGMLQGLFGTPAPQRSLDGMIAFFDLVIVTAIAFGGGGLIAGIMAAQAISVWATVAAATAAAVIPALAMAPSSVAKPFYGAGLLAGALVAAGIAGASRSLRPVDGGQDR